MTSVQFVTHCTPSFQLWVSRSSRLRGERRHWLWFAPHVSTPYYSILICRVLVELQHARGFEERTRRCRSSCSRFTAAKITRWRLLMPVRTTTLPSRFNCGNSPPEFAPQCDAHE